MSDEELPPVEEESALGLQGAPFTTAKPEPEPEPEPELEDEGETDASDESTAVATRPEPGPEPGDAGRQPPPKQTVGLLRVARLLLAPVLATAAVWVHMELNVPDEPVIVEKKDQGGKARRAGGRRPPERNPAQMNVSWDRWSVQPFEGEPIKGKWGRKTQSLVSKSVVVARKFAFLGSPEAPRVIALENQCRTIRCRFVLRSPYKHEVDLVAQTLPHLQANGEPVFRDVTSEFIDAPKKQMPKDDHYLQVTVGIQIDGVRPSEVELDPSFTLDGKPAKAAGDTKAPAEP